MRTILIAHRDVGFAEELARDLRSGGYRVIVCPGPQPPQRCIRCEKGYCPLTEGADVMIYDPRLTSTDKEDQVHNLAADAAVAHSEVPMLLAWTPSTVPDVGTLRAIRAQAPWVRIAEHMPNRLRDQIDDLLLAAPVRIPVRSAP